MEYKMYVHKEELRIIDLFRRNLLKEFTLREIMAKLGKKSYNWTYKAINRMSSSAMLTAQKKGKTTVLRANLNSPDLITHLMQLDKEDAYKNSIPLADELIDKIAAKTPFFILLVVGSYATGQQTKKSDVDAVIIVPDRRKTEELKPYIAEIRRLAEPPLDAHIFTKEEFLRMLLRDEENLGKETFRKHLLFYGTEPYYQIIKEAAKNGLQAKI